MDTRDRLTSLIGPVLLEAFPNEHRVTRGQVADALAVVLTAFYESLEAKSREAATAQDRRQSRNWPPETIVTEKRYKHVLQAAWDSVVPDLPPINFTDAEAAHIVTYIGAAGGMKPWTGGSEPPTDWDGGQVAFRDGGLSTMKGSWLWRHNGGNSDIIAYTPRLEVDAAEAGKMAEALSVIGWGDVPRLCTDRPRARTADGGGRCAHGKPLYAECIECIRAYARAATAPGEPNRAGYVLVPLEPTETMLDAGVTTLQNCQPDEWVPPSRVWSAMLAAYQTT